MAIGAKKKKRIMSSEELSSFCDQIALMLSSGMTLRDTRWWMRPAPSTSP